MDVTFVIPSYQKGRFIGDCLDSIAAQNLPAGRFEVWVIDAGSTDATLEIVREHPLQPRWVSEPDRGQAHAVNKGIARARGEVIAWINADDLYRPGALHAVLDHFREHPRVQWLYGEGDCVDAAGRLMFPYETRDWNPWALAERCFICQPAAFFRRDAVRAVGGLREDLHLVLDVDLWFRLGAQSTPARLPGRLAALRHYEETKSAKRQLAMQWEALRVAYVHTGRRSSRRMWGVVDNLARSALHLPRPDKARGDSRLVLGPLWALKFLLFPAVALAALTLPREGAATAGTLEQGDTAA